MSYNHYEAIIWTQYVFVQSIGSVSSISPWILLGIGWERKSVVSHITTSRLQRRPSLHESRLGKGQSACSGLQADLWLHHVIGREERSSSQTHFVVFRTSVGHRKETPIQTKCKYMSRTLCLIWKWPRAYQHVARWSPAGHQSSCRMITLTLSLNTQIKNDQRKHASVWLRKQTSSFCLCPNKESSDQILLWSAGTFRLTGVYFIASAALDVSVGLLWSGHPSNTHLQSLVPSLWSFKKLAYTSGSYLECVGKDG